MKKILTWLFTFSITAGGLQAQTTRPADVLSDEREITYVFRQATLVADANTIIKDAVLIIRKDRIVQVGTGLPIPPGAVVYELKNRYIYPAFIESYSGYGIPEPKQRESSRRERGGSGTGSLPGAPGWNMAIHPEYDAVTAFITNGKQAEELRKLGFGTALTLQRDGIARGTAALLLLGDQPAGQLVVKDRAAMCFSFDKGTATQDYPSSLMGSIALLRQTYLDAQWYATAKEKEYNASLEALNAGSRLPQLFEVNGYRSALRADRLGDEFGVRYILRGEGDEYKRINEIKNTGCNFIIPLNFPKAYDVSNPYDALNVSLSDLKHWELAPANPALLEKAGVPFALTSDGLKDRKDFIPALLKAVRNGLSKEAALTALTTTPARYFGVENQLGALRPGMLASFFICTGDYFEKDNQLLENWVAGKRFLIRAADSIDISGSYTAEIDTFKKWNLTVAGDPLRPEFVLKQDSVNLKIESLLTGSQWTLRFEAGKGKGHYRLNGTYNAETKTFSGAGQTPTGTWITWKAVRTGAGSAKKDSTRKDTVLSIPAIYTPNMAFGWDSAMAPPRAGTIFIKNITVWTCENAGILQNAAVLIRDGRIAEVLREGETTKADLRDATVIDGTGKHLTPGIIDEHSHIAINEGVNEGTRSITSEVRIGDVLDPDDIDIYRQLAGGVTTAHLLHGSANAIGGQTALIKLRWGQPAEALKFAGADPFIKFALGENVKQSNWGDNNITRYPQTRMGVEQVYLDAFHRARAYQQNWQRWKNSKGANSTTPRRDLELDALAAILNKKMFITCHSYQQGEINMLLHVADTFGFRVNTFTHILEGYKVADKMKAHGVGASSFSDWWAYKYEVLEAIPYNGAILHKMGILTAFNSDDAEMARRLNQEAAKAVKYGNVSPEDALKFVTIHPARLLHIDERTGSIKAGKDADLVIWNGPPLSVYSKPLQTYVDGIPYYDETRDAALRERDRLERQRLIRKMQDEKSGGGATQRPTVTLHEDYHCNDLEHLPYEDEH